MSQGMYSAPRLFLGGTEIMNFTNISYSNKGNNTISTLNIKISDPDLDNAGLLGKEVVFFLNYGSNDTVPFFRGYIKEYTPTEKNISIKARDVLTFLAGTDTPPLVITDDSNFDGFTLSQMLFDYVERVVNRNGVKIGLDMLNDTDPPVTLTGYRKSNIHPLKIVQQKIPKNISSISDIRSYRLIVRDDGTKSNICFVKEQDADSSGITFGFNNGIEKLSYKKRPDPNYYTMVVNKNIMEYQHNSLPIGITMGKMGKKKYEFPDEAREDAFLQATVAEDKKEITITTNKGHYLEIGNVINLVTPEYPDITGKHRILSKSVQYTGTKVSCQLKLSRESAFLADYLGKIEL